MHRNAQLYLQTYLQSIKEMLVKYFFHYCCNFHYLFYLLKPISFASFKLKIFPEVFVKIVTRIFFKFKALYFFEISIIFFWLKFFESKKLCK